MKGSNILTDFIKISIHERIICLPLGDCLAQKLIGFGEDWTMQDKTTYELIFLFDLSFTLKWPLIGLSDWLSK